MLNSGAVDALTVVVTDPIPGNVAYVAGTPEGGNGARVYRVDVASGETRQLGRIRGNVTITGLAALQS